MEMEPDVQKEEEDGEDETPTSQGAAVNLLPRLFWGV